MLKGSRTWIVWKQSYKNVKGKLDNMEHVQMEYWETDIEKVNEVNFLNEEFDEFTSSGVKVWLM